ncbi:MAG: flavin reductase [Clostridia bacterium]|nr:flavin reductase [Clostridia bacterium]
MEGWKQILPEDFNESVFRLLDKDWALLSAKREDGAVNQMTVSWGGVGVLWGKPVAFLFVRPERYTHGFMTDNAKISLSFFSGEYKSALAYCGKHSGREGDKATAAGLHFALLEGGYPTYEEARLSFALRKLFEADMQKEQFVDTSLLKFYEKDGLHTVYVCEIEEIYCR